MGYAEDNNNGIQSLVAEFEHSFIQEDLLTQHTIDSIKNEFNLAVQIMNEWKLSPEERILLCLETPAESYGNMLMDLKILLIEAVQSKYGTNLSEEEQDAIQANVLRSRTPLLNGRTPLEFVNGQSVNLEILLKTAYEPR